MKKIIHILISVLLFTFSITTFSNVFDNCPSFNNKSVLTQNGNGNSSYEDPFLEALFKSLPQFTKFNVNDPILDVGAGYGSSTFELIKLGAKNIYINDLDKNNLICAKNNIKHKYSNKNIKLAYVPGNIVSDQVLSQLPDQYFNLIIAKNIIHFLTYEELIKFIKVLNQKSKTDGVVVIFFENPHINKLNYMIKMIYESHKNLLHSSLEESVKSIYNNKSFIFPAKMVHGGTLNRHCSFETYSRVLHDMKLPGFPCELPVGHGKGQLLLPEIIISLMSAGGFNKLYQKSFSDHGMTQLLIFSKVINESWNQIDINIQNIFKTMQGEANNAVRDTSPSNITIIEKNTGSVVTAKLK